MYDAGNRLHDSDFLDKLGVDLSKDGETWTEGAEKQTKAPTEKKHVVSINLAPLANTEPHAS